LTFYYWSTLITNAVNGCRLRRDAEWETCVPVIDCSWKQIAEPVMKTYTETTDGSTIENKETAIVWCYEDADPDFGSCQAKELHDHLESVLSNEPVSVKAGPNLVEVKPQVSPACCCSQQQRLLLIQLAACDDANKNAANRDLPFCRA
jgi:trehalose-phosphatase